MGVYDAAAGLLGDVCVSSWTVDEVRWVSSVKVLHISCCGLGMERRPVPISQVHLLFETCKNSPVTPTGGHKSQRPRLSHTGQEGLQGAPNSPCVPQHLYFSYVNSDQPAGLSSDSMSLTHLPKPLIFLSSWLAGVARKAEPSLPPSFSCLEWLQLLDGILRDVRWMWWYAGFLNSFAVMG